MGAEIPIFGGISEQTRDFEHLSACTHCVGNLQLSDRNSENCNLLPSCLTYDATSNLLWPCSARKAYSAAQGILMRWPGAHIAARGPT